jgi:hypothetical protein
MDHKSANQSRHSKQEQQSEQTNMLVGSRAMALYGWHEEVLPQDEHISRRECIPCPSRLLHQISTEITDLRNDMKSAISSITELLMAHISAQKEIKSRIASSENPYEGCKSMVASVVDIDDSDINSSISINEWKERAKAKKSGALLVETDLCFAL